MQNEINNGLMDKIDQLVINNVLIDEIEKEESWKDRTGLEFDGLCGAIETIIFMSDRPVPLLRLKKVIDDEIPLKIIHEAIQKLQIDYEKKHHGIRLVEVADGFQFRTKAIYSRFVQDLFKITGLTLTPSCLEVLAIIAYRQPVSKFDIEKIRGVDSSHLIRTLMDKRLVKLLGRSEDMGRPSIYGTTAEFLDVFNLPDLNALPPEYELDAIIESKKVDISQISQVRNASRETFIFDDIDELEELATKIRSIATSTTFTSDLNSNQLNDGVRKNAFELLESHIDKNLINQTMKLACESETLGIPDEIKIITDLLGPFANAPIEEDEFEMIDLDTGEAILNEEFLDDDEEDLAEDELANIEVVLCDDENEECDGEDALLTSFPQTKKIEEIVNNSKNEVEGIVLDAHSLFENEDSEELDNLESAMDAAFDKFKNAQKRLFSEDSEGEFDNNLDYLGVLDDLELNSDSNDLDSLNNEKSE